MKTIYTLVFLTISMTCFSQSFKDLKNKKYNNVYALFVGISDYKEIQDLKFADNDAVLMQQTLGHIFPEQKENFELLTNEQATHANILNGIRKMILNATENDLVVFYFSGQADATEDIMEGNIDFLLAHEASKSKIYYPAGGGIELKYLTRAFNKAIENKANVWLMTDACHSMSTDSKTPSSTLNQQFKNTTKFTSCGVNEMSYEYPVLNHGVFTYFLAKALLGDCDTEDVPGSLNADEINSYLRKKVRKFTESKQTPKVSSNDEFDNIISITPEMTKLLETLNNENQGQDALNGTR